MDVELPDQSRSRVDDAHEEANGYRRVHPDELGHLTAQQARALERSERGHPAETPEEDALYSSILVDAGVDEAPLVIASMS